MLSSGGEEGGNATLQSSFPGTTHLIPSDILGNKQGSPYSSLVCRRHSGSERMSDKPKAVQLVSYWDEENSAIYCQDHSNLEPATY